MPGLAPTYLKPRFTCVEGVGGFNVGNEGAPVAGEAGVGGVLNGGGDRFRLVVLHYYHEHALGQFVVEVVADLGALMFVSCWRSKIAPPSNYIELERHHINPFYSLFTSIVTREPTEVSLTVPTIYGIGRGMV